MEFIDFWHKIGYRLSRIKRSIKRLMLILTDLIMILLSTLFTFWILQSTDLILTDAHLKWFKRTVIIHSHNSSTRGKRKVVHKCLKAFQDNFADYRVACSDFAANWMFSKNVLDQVTFWPNALNIDSLKFDEISREELRQKYGATKKFIIGNVGRLSFKKINTSLLIFFLHISVNIPMLMLNCG